MANLERHPELKALRQSAREIFDCALNAADCQKAIQAAVTFDGSTLTIFNDKYDPGDKDIYLVSVGKAALSTATALTEILTDRIHAGIIVGALGHGSPIILPAKQSAPISVLTTGEVGQAITLPISAASARRWRAYSGGHPLPNIQSLKAGWETSRLVKQANDDCALIIFLISGGGSAMLEWPRAEDITLDDLRSANSLLVTCGASIAEINAVRRSFSALKGGGLAALAPEADQITLIVSDTNAGEESNVSSGPTLPAPKGSPSAKRVIERYGLRDKLPASIVRLIETHPAKTSVDSERLRKTYLLMDNGTALAAAATKANELGYVVKLADDIVEQRIDAGVSLMLDRMRKIFQARKSDVPVCLLSGGEFATPVHGSGIGGRNLETVLRCAMEIARQRHAPWRHVVALSAGTDGIDGNSPAAGGIVDETTIPHAEALGLNPSQYLENSDSFRLLQILDSVLLTGPTGTNVRDVRILFGV